MTVLNPAPARPLPEELLALVNTFTPNESELFDLAGPGCAGSINTAVA